MNDYARSGIIMIGLVAAMCGAVILLTEPLQCRMKELERKNNLKGTSR